MVDSKYVSSNIYIYGLITAATMGLVYWQARRREDIWGSGGIAPPVSTSALDGCERLVSLRDCFNPGKRGQGAHLKEGWLGLRASLDAVKYRKIPCPSRESNPGSPAHSLSLYLLSYQGSISKHVGRKICGLFIIKVDDKMLYSVQINLLL
jgi:hypothetical protein